MPSPINVMKSESIWYSFDSKLITLKKICVSKNPYLILYIIPFLMEWNWWSHLIQLSMYRLTSDNMVRILTWIPTRFLNILKKLNLNNPGLKMSPMIFYQIFLRTSSPVILTTTWSIATRGGDGENNPGKRGMWPSIYYTSMLCISLTGLE